jgi:ABC-type proline/glycine betaine transport system permease subunit
MNPQPGCRTNKGEQREDTMNHTMYSADRGTHLKIVVIGLLCATLVGVVGIFAHVSDIDLGTAPLVKAGQPTTVSGGPQTVR